MDNNTQTVVQSFLQYLTQRDLQNLKTLNMLEESINK